MFSFRSLMVSGVTFMFLMHFKLIFVRDVRWGSSFILLCQVFPTPFVEKTVLSPLNIVGSFVK